MKTVTKEQIKAIKPGQSILFSLDDSSCLARAKQAVQYLKVNLQMPEGVTGYHTSFDRQTNVFTVTALG